MFEDIAQDSRSSATVLTGLAARRLAEMAETSDAGDPGSFWDELLDACRELIDAKREMASIVNLVGRVLSSAERMVLSGLSPEVARRAVFMQCNEAWEFADADLESLGKKGAPLVPADGTIATLGASESVRAILVQAAASGTEFRVVVAESRPGREGVEFAGSLPAWDIPVTVVADAALPDLLDRCGLVLVGSGSVSETDFVNKVGTYPLALVAKEKDVPVYVAALSDKLLPSALRGGTGRLMDERELMEERPAGVAVENRYFERTPLSLVRGVVTEDGILAPEEIPARLASQPVAPALLQLLFPRRAPRDEDPSREGIGTDARSPGDPRER